MKKLKRENLLSLEEYARQRADFRSRVMAHKRNRHLHLGAHASLYFEDRLTMHYQIQEMLRAERLFTADEIEAELEVYNPLIPDGSNWKATFMIEFKEENKRRQALQNLVGIEDTVWVRIAGFDKVYAIADGDLEREQREKTAAVHFLRFELAAGMIKALGEGATLSAGIDHPEMRVEVKPVPEAVRSSLFTDLG